MFALLAIQQPETMSLLEQPLFAPRLSNEERSVREGALAAARGAYDRDRGPAETLPEASCALGIAQYLAPDYAHARESFTKCPDPGVFAYLADWRTGRSAMPRPSVSRDRVPDPSAPTPIRMPGASTKPGPATRIPMAAMYLDAAERLIQGKTEAAKDLLKQIVEKDRNNWMDPVYIAAEADYARILKAEGKRPKAKPKKR